MQTTTGRLSTIALAYLAAEQLTPRGNGWNGYPVLACDEPMQPLPLSTALLASAVLALRAAGAIALEPVEKHILGTTSRSVRVIVLKPAADCGADAALLAAVSDTPRERIFDVVKRWLGRDHRRPREYVLRRAFAEAHREGYVVPVRVPRSRCSGAATARVWPRGICDPERMVRIAPAIAAVVERWRALESDSKLRRCLLHEIDAAFRFRTKDL